MFVDARTLPAGERIEADICIVGAGAAGITLALELAGEGRHIILTESGGFEPDRQTQELYNGESIGLDYRVQETRRRLFGGTTNVWGGACRPLDQMDFAPRDWIAHSGWPFARSDLLPFYKRARPYLQLPQDEDKPLPFPWRDPWQAALWEGSPSTRFGERYRGALEQAPGVTVLLNANLLGLEIWEADTVKSSLFGSFGDRHHSIAAQRYVLACGGLENARLLLIASRTEAGSTMNRHDLIGRFFMEHPSVRLGYLAHEHAGTPEACFFAAGGHSFRISDDSQRAARIGAAGFYPFGPLELAEIPALEAALDSSLRRPLKRLADTIGRRKRTIMRRGPVSTIHLVFEQTPDPDSRVTLGSERDEFGLPRLRLDWRLNALDRNTYATAVRLLAKQVGDPRVGRFWMRPALRGIDFNRPEAIPLDLPFARDFELMPHHPNTEIISSSHHMGTTRMHADPRYGVADSHGLVHGTRNLYVAGSSTFPTVGISNPTFTIVALTLRLADHLKHGV